MTTLKKILIGMLAVLLAFGMIPAGVLAEAYSGSYDYNIPTVEAGDEPLIVIGAISDSHTDYNLQNSEPYIRPAFITAMDVLKAEGIDLLLVGGDMTSDNQDSGGKYRWKSEVYNRTIAQYKKYSSAASKTGITLWACGNHDQEVGRYEDLISAGDYNSYEGFMNLMLATAGYPLSLYTQETDAGATSLFSDQWLGAHYNVEGFDFIIINASSWQTYSAGTLNWLDNTLSGIGADKTVFVMGHYPLQDNRGVTNPSSYGISGDAQTAFKAVMNKYNNAIYLYGHNHGTANGIKPWIQNDVFERITHYDASGSPVNDREAAPASFITAFMGSAGYYDGSLGANDPSVVQAMTITVYADRIEFKMINCGASNGGASEPAIWTVARDVKSSGSPEEKEILVSDEVNADVYYGSALGITKYKMSSKATSLTFDYHTIEAEGLDGLSFTVKRLASGTKYIGYTRKLSKVVNQAVLFDYTVKKGNKKVDIETPVKVTLPALTGEFGSKTSTLDIAAYYWDNDGKLCMTDVQINEDGTYSFIMTNLSPFALSARASVADQLSEIKADKKGSSNADTTAIIIAVACVATVAVIAVIVILVVKKSKKRADQDVNEKAEN